LINALYHTQGWCGSNEENSDDGESHCHKDGDKPSISAVLLEDPNYGAALAYSIDQVALITLSIAYIIAIPVILATQSGYTDLFSNLG